MTRTVSLVLLSLFIAACSAAPPPSEPPTERPASPTPQQPEPAPTEPLPEGFYLRAWSEQALPPEATFSWLPVLTIHEGLAIDGNVAIPLIFPGPLLVLPNVRGISQGALAEIIELAEQLGLLSGQADFTGDELLPGGESAQLLLIVDGTRYELVGDPLAYDGSPSPEPGSPQAFAAFWQQIGYLDGWLAEDLGPGTTYAPERLAVLTMPAAQADEQVPPNFAEWPLERAFAQLGTEFSAAPEARCLVVTGSELETLLPVLLQANQLTIFVDGQDEARSLVVRPLVPLEPSPCGDEA